MMISPRDFNARRRTTPKPDTASEASQANRTFLIDRIVSYSPSVGSNGAANATR